VHERVRTERLVGTRPVPDDALELAPILADPAVAQWLWPGELGGPRSLEQTLAMVARDVAHWERHGFGMWMVRDRDSGALIGRVGLQHTEVDGEVAVEVGWILDPAGWGRGLASEFAAAALDVAFSRLGLDEVVAFTLPHNAASRGVMRRLGLTYVRDIVHAGLPHVLYVARPQTAHRWPGPAVPAPVDRERRGQ
jgi:RimJ/RimL family protein N-acetyltransferase